LKISNQDLIDADQVFDRDQDRDGKLKINVRSKLQDTARQFLHRGIIIPFLTQVRHSRNHFWTKLMKTMKPVHAGYWMLPAWVW